MISNVMQRLGGIHRAPGWDSELTVNSTGPVDLPWASRDMLLSLPGMTEPIVDQFLAVRGGPDGIDGTEDDPHFKTLDEVRVALGFSPEQFKQLAPLVGFRDQVLRVISVGKSGDVTRRGANGYPQKQATSRN